MYNIYFGLVKQIEFRRGLVKARLLVFYCAVCAPFFLYPFWLKRISIITFKDNYTTDLRTNVSMKCYSQLTTDTE